MHPPKAAQLAFSSQAEAHPFDIKDITPPCEAAVGKNCLFADDCVLFLLMFHR